MQLQSAVQGLRDNALTLTRCALVDCRYSGAMPANTWQIASPAPDFPFVHTCLFHNAALKWFPHIGGIALGGGESVVAWWMAVVHETAHSPPLALRIHTKTHTKYTSALDVCKSSVCHGSVCMKGNIPHTALHSLSRVPYTITQPRIPGPRIS